MRLELKKCTNESDELTLADKIAVLEGDKVRQFDMPHEIYNNPENRFVADCMDSPAMNFIKYAVRGDKLVINSAGTGYYSACLMDTH